MFFIFNKDKLTAYVITVFTVGILFFTASAFNNSKDTIQTSVNTITNNKIINNLQNNILIK